RSTEHTDRTAPAHTFREHHNPPSTSRHGILTNDGNSHPSAGLKHLLMRAKANDAVFILWTAKFQGDHLLPVDQRTFAPVTQADRAALEDGLLSDLPKGKR